MTQNLPSPTPEFLAYRDSRRDHWDRIAERRGKWQGMGGYYHSRLSTIYSSIISPGQKVLEIGCAEGNLLAAVKPSEGLGVDFSERMIARARRSHPELSFIDADFLTLEIHESFDIIILSDIVNDLWDVQAVLEKVRSVAHGNTRIVLNMYNRLWEIPLLIAQKLGLCNRLLPQNWLTLEDIQGLMGLAGFQIIRTWQEILLPLGIPVIHTLCNRFFARLWPCSLFSLSNFITARLPSPDGPAKPSVSVIVPARNEKGNIADLFRRVPDMGSGTELVFVEGNSNDDTYGEIERCMGLATRDARLLKQPGKGKADAVRVGFEQARGDILMILDADMTVAPEDLPRFYNALVSGRGDFVNGVRLVYPMEKNAMRFLNLVGNKFFCYAFSWILGQHVKDTLCGTKVLWKTNYRQIEQNRCYFGDFDPFGDFDLLFGAARLHMKIIDMPIRYHERTYGTTNIQRWQHGFLLLRMLLVGARKLKFTR